MSGFLTATRMLLLNEMYGARASAVATLLADYKMPVGQNNPILGSFFANIDPLRQASIDYLVKRNNVPPSALTRDGDGYGMALGEAMVEIDDHGRFEFSDPPHDETAARALITVARDVCGDPLDLVAWAPRADKLAAFHGRASMLGEHELADAHFDEPLRVHRGVLPWLQADRCGVVVLDPVRARRLLDGELLGAIDVQHGLELRRVLQPPAPRIVVRQLDEAAA